MKILWLCNIIPPIIAKELHLNYSNKEGWISGLADTVLKNRYENQIELFIASPMNVQRPDEVRSYIRKEVCTSYGIVSFFCFPENLDHPEKYDVSLEHSMESILTSCNPDLVHCFGTEYPHTLAMCKVFPDKSKLIIHIQGLCSVYANAYFANLPEKVIKSSTLRDKLKKDSLLNQQKKFVERGNNEIEAIRLAGNICGRTKWDKYYARKWHFKAQYFKIKETLRSEFYEGKWDEAECERHSIFLSQGDYPIKGLHYMLAAMPEILKKIPDTKLYVAGNNITNNTTFLQKLKISAYGKYLRELIRSNSLENKVIFLGKLDASEMKAQYLKSHLFVCCSSIENSPNSLGEAMMLGMPCVSADVGGISSIFVKDKKSAGILYKGFESPENEFDYHGNYYGTEEEKMMQIAGNLSEAVVNMWTSGRKLVKYCRDARELAENNHDRQENYDSLIQMYKQIMENNQ